MTDKLKKGFTLIELLIVIVLIGILAGIVITVLQPARLQRRARETVMRTNVEKLCLGLKACAATTQDAQNCDEFEEIGVAGDPTSATYAVTDQPDALSNYCITERAYDASAPLPADCTAQADTAATLANADKTVVITGSRVSDDTVGSETYCSFYCAYDFLNNAVEMDLSALEVAGPPAVVTDCSIGTN